MNTDSTELNDQELKEQIAISVRYQKSVMLFEMLCETLQIKTAERSFAKASQRMSEDSKSLEKLRVTVSKGDTLQAVGDTNLAEEAESGTNEVSSRASEELTL